MGEFGYKEDNVKLYFFYNYTSLWRIQPPLYAAVIGIQEKDIWLPETNRLQPVSALLLLQWIQHNVTRYSVQQK